MAIVRWDPLRTLMRWPNLWEDDEWSHLSPTIPSHLDVYETSSEVVVRATIAGVSEENVNITFEKGVLTISAEESSDSEGKKYYQKATRSYSYRVAIPGNVDVKSDPKASIDKGVVEVTFNKIPEEKPKKIQISKK